MARLSIMVNWWLMHLLVHINGYLMFKVPWSTWCMLWWPKLANNANYRDFFAWEDHIFPCLFYQGYNVAYKTSKIGEIRAYLVPLTWDSLNFPYSTMVKTLLLNLKFKVVPFEWYCPLVGLMIKRGIERCPLVVTNVK